MQVGNRQQAATALCWWNRKLVYFLLISAALGGCAGVNRYPTYGRSHPVVIEGRVVSVTDLGTGPLMQRVSNDSGTVFPYDLVRLEVGYVDQNRTGSSVVATDTISTYCFTSTTGYSARYDKTYSVSPIFAEKLVVGRAAVFGLDVFEGKWVIRGVEDSSSLRSREYEVRF